MSGKNMMVTISEYLELAGTRPLVRDSSGRATREYLAVRMLQKLLQLRPELGSKRLYLTATEAESNGECGVTEPLRVPVLYGHGDMRVFDKVVHDMNKIEGTEWSLVVEEAGAGYPGISIWRKPSKDYRYEL